MGTGEPVVLAGVFDCLSALLAEAAGHTDMFLSGYCTAATLLGVPDFGYVTQTEMADVARRVCHAVPDRSVIVDGDTGYGNPLNTIRTIELYEHAGAAGHLPRGPGVAEEVRAHGRQAGRARATSGWASSAPPSTTATTCSSSPAPMPEPPSVSTRRAHAPRRPPSSGVDAIFVEAPESVEEMEAIAAATPGCVRVANMIEGGRTPLRTPSELHDLGFDLIVSPLTGLLAAHGRWPRRTALLRAEGTLRDHLDLVTSFDDFAPTVDLDGHYALEARYVDR